ncbi:bifunctional 4-hydroxy-3-methylbut-2-enyl diphosphate reductase/30S ribosomal protein S1 [Herbinix luporum]|uniref:bifunctional 4-hydroxy-3-methylbut-2-enyl diphosphate reductase/30S ribosomal protein S1 n=1 Tax=Herbinix luporum TaxID=1679721 RepID=UPI00175548A1|nr:bifunctional 4-hydroxy-3-methylbut-2-enyl diphosphate reductase/30S ribosomal protein S1 [Herbinix luporum]MDI9489198.1 bifunctional 4-hydroxy-3-methylbut-2-enyl diphosphate reductase/30S ribosomal protein S1 [Bacillota bacterium]HHT56716.1 bifunctional 4-hydroxy-3-methylbut-2-enyl diphosphate reductase/30S ribosomal protein S1 [Herbinix luporum]
MKIKVADSAGFCFGVQRAVDLVYKEISNGLPIYTYGPIIHNDEVVEDLRKKGVKVIETLEELKDLPKGTIIIRSHGISRKVYDEISSYGHNIKDATCPFVKKIHNIVNKQDERHIIIVGNPGHPEVQGIMGWCNNNYTVVEDIEGAMNFNLPLDVKICIVAQTTYNYNRFQDLVEIISKKGYDIFVLNTICNATQSRQQEAYELAKKSDAMIVIGGKQSSNTRKLYEICKKECENTYYIQKLDDLDLNSFKSFRNVGITAGASTPHNIIKEVLTVMSEKSFEQLLEEENVVEINNGDVVEGIVLGVKEDEIILNIGYKSEGIITRNEYTNTPNLDLTTVVKPGDKMEAKVLKVNDGEGQVALTYKRLAAEKGNKRLEEAYNNKEVLTAKVAAVLKGGLSVIIDEARVFIPASLISDTYEKDLSKYAGQEIEFVITEFNPRKRRVIGDRKQLIVAKKEEMKKELFEKIQVGMTIEGTVKNITDFGAFIDLGGADGLLHISEMSWGRVDNPKKLFKVGDTVKAFVKDIQGEKIALSLKFEDQNPWLTAEEKYATGNVVSGVVARMTDFGAFVELEPGIDALLHVSQISKEHVEKPSDVLSIGEEITAKVVEFNKEDKKISLSVKALEVAENANQEQDKEQESESNDASTTEA